MYLSKKETSKIAHAKARWDLKVATLKGDPSLPGIVALSIYDSKPFYFISNACEVVKWNKITCKVWSKEKNRMVEMPFFRLNLIHDYNIGMNARPDQKYLPLGYICAQEEVVVVNYDVVSTDAT